MLSGRMRGQELKTATLRDFSGGWNALDDDLNLAAKFSVKQYNCYYGVDGNNTVRYGTAFFANAAAALTTSATLINAEYFNDAIWAVFSNGEIVRILGDGSVERMWDSSIAAALPDAPSGWSSGLTYASFCQFNSELIIVNGIDKPLIVHQNNSVEYLYDLATGSNLNVPIARYVLTALRYVIMLGDPVNPNRVHISARDTSGTWYGDPAPNDGTYVDLGSVITNGTIIRGAAAFRDRLIVAYAEGAIIGQLGIYDADGAHTPNFDDGVDHYGAIAHRALLSYGDDMLMMDGVGVSSLKRTVFTGTIRPERVSDLVDPEMTSQMLDLSFGSLEDRCFSVYNRNEGQFMFFVPNADTLVDTTETTAYVFTFRPSLNVSAWSRWDGWNWVCGLRSSQGNVFFGTKEGKFYRYGSKQNPVIADFLNDPEINSGEGIPIDFTWELPWIDFNKRAKSKTSKYIAFDCRGTGQFDVKMFIDNRMYDSDGEEEPNMQMTLTAGGTGGYGSGEQPYGGGRNTNDQHLLAWPSKFQIAKLRMSGSTTGGLAFNSITIHYQEGGIFR